MSSMRTVMLRTEWVTRLHDSLDEPAQCTVSSFSIRDLQVDAKLPIREYATFPTLCILRLAVHAMRASTPHGPGYNLHE
ncbi:hypothetical protein CY34DRAFT_769802 [Suillus luteus UH-Slu-Lm8-n1]|uniref:Uncharacterized protein n=1 Tax=Suillus luteus UH-Slu-Lm8-n1 TaxID=930992 RepID=A0A0D0AME8_9AGAM|nr:hypothetical protein CY34DRAFT_769802 [Suillus luteus UH-Slu-Lm8-n1]